jgi:hypothetical protein
MGTSEAKPKRSRGKEEGKESELKKDEPSASGKGRKDDDDIDESDLLADAAAVLSQDQRPGPIFIGHAFGSVSLSRRHPAMQWHSFFENIAKRAPPMPRLGQHKQ